MKTPFTQKSMKMKRSKKILPALAALILVSAVVAEIRKCKKEYKRE